MECSKWFFSGLICSVSLFFLSAHAADSKSAVAGKVITVTGTVLIRSGDDPNAKAEVLKAGTFFHTSDVINTPSDGTAKLLLNDRSILDIRPSTLFHVNKFDAKQGNNREVDLEMNYGAVRFAVTKPLQGQGKFKIRTPTATMGVRGTDGEVGHDLSSQKSFGAIVSGLGTFSTNGGSGSGSKPVTINLPAGTTVTLAPQGSGVKAVPPVASKISPTQLSSYRQSVQKNDAFRNSIEVKASTASNSGSASKSSGNSTVAKNDKKDDSKKEEGKKEEGKKDEGKKEEGKKEEAKKDDKKEDKKDGTAKGPATAVAAAPAAAPAAETGRAPAAAESSAPGAAEASVPAAAAPAAESPAVVNSTLAAAAVEVATSVAAQPVIEMPTISVPVVTAAPVVVPAGGLRHITIKVTR